MERLIHKGILSYRVTKLSKNAAMRKTGTNPKTIFKPSRPPFNIETLRLKVPGNKILLPTIKPAAPAITIAQTSKVP